MRFDNCRCGNKKQIYSKLCIDCHRLTMKGNTSPRYKNDRIKRICMECEIEYITRPMYKLKFCSQKCCGIWKHKNIKGEKVYNYIKDRTLLQEKHRLRNTLEWVNWRKLVFERDKYTCKKCGKRNIYLEPHHIIPIRENIKQIFNINNGITLCRPCHIKTMWKESNFVKEYSLLVAA